MPQPHTHGSLPQPVAEDNVRQNSAVPVNVSASSQQSSTPDPTHPVRQVTPTPVAQDTDVIEAGWIHQVDNLVKQKISDPQVLSQEFFKLKAQYIAGRYGKDIKQTDGKN